MDTDSPHVFTSNCMVKEKFKKKVKKSPLLLVAKIKYKMYFHASWLAGLWGGMARRSQQVRVTVTTYYERFLFTPMMLVFFFF